MTPSVPSPHLWTGVVRFHRALAVALADFEIEKQGITIRHYFDTDVLLKTINGLLDHDSFDFVRPAYPLVRTFFSLGYLGPACVLRPHALELVRKLRVPIPNIHGLYHDKLQRAIKSSNILVLRETIHNLVRQKNDEKRRARIIDTLKAHGTKALIILELSNGSREERLRRLRKDDLIRTSGNEPSIHMLLSHRLTALVADVLASTRTEKRSNNLRDACALASLSHYIQRSSVQPGNTVVRFYSETHDLNRLIADHEEVRKYLSYDQLPILVIPQYDEDIRCVLRDADYYLVRSIFRAVAFPLHRDFSEVGIDRRHNDSVDAITPTLEELRSVVMHLGSVLTSPNPNKEALDRFRIGERTLSETITEFQALAILDMRILSRLEREDSVKLVDPKLGDLFDLVKPFSVHRQVRSELRKIVDALNRHVQSWKEWQVATDEIVQAVELRYSEMRGSTGEQFPNVLRDLGLIRWGMDLTQAPEERIKDCFEELTSKNPGSRSVACGALAAQVSQPTKSVEDVTFVSSLLWLFGLDKKLYTYIDRCYGPTIPSTSIRLMRTAAELIGNNDLTIHKKQKLIDTALRAVEREGSDDSADSPEVREKQAQFWLGIGYIYYYAWFSEIRIVPISRQLSSQLRRIAENWLQRSFEAGQKVISLARHRQLTWAFGMNHCAYVGTVGHFDPTFVSKCIKELLAIRNNRDLWNYRFHDTCAWHLVMTAQRLWNTTDKEGATADERWKYVLDLLADAEAEYKELEKESCFGDLVPQRHSMELKQFRQEVIASRLRLHE